MPTIPITDGFSVPIDVDLAPGSTLLQYARDLPGLVLHGGDLSQWRVLTLADPALRSLAPSLAFERPIPLGAGAPLLTLQADAGVSFRVITRPPDPDDTSADRFPDDVPIPQGSCYIALGCHANAGAEVDGTAGMFGFGVQAGGGFAITSYQRFANDASAPTIAEALRQSLGALVIPLQPADLNALRQDAVVTLAGSGSLKISGSANLLAIANPLATLALPSPVPALSVQQSGSVTVGASWELATEFELRIWKKDSRHVRLGWYRTRATDFDITASASAGLTAGVGDTDLWGPIIGAISPSARADLATLRAAGLSEDDAREIQHAVKAAADRKLAAGLEAEWSRLRSNEAAFLYEVDLAALDADGRAALAAALRGDLSELGGRQAPPAGITELRSVLSTARASRFTFRVNLLGIFNFGSVATLALQGSVTYTPSTGELVIADQATASRIRSSAVAFGADEDKLSHVLSESLLLTAAYRGSRAAVAAPELASFHQFFRLDRDATADDIDRAARIATALGFGAPQLPGIDRFGRTSVYAEARYDDAGTRSLFLNPDGTPRSEDDYERAGRRAVAFLVPPGGDDAFRLRPATDDALWQRMKTLGPPNFNQLLPPEQANGVTPDYLAIRWWAQSMRSTGELLARINQEFQARPGAAPGDPAFQQLRAGLADHLRDVAGKAREQFGSPWGLVAMFLVSGAAAPAALEISSRAFAYHAATALAAPSAS